MKVVPAESSVCNDRISLPGVAGCLGGGGGSVISPTVGPGQSPGGGPGVKLQRSCSTQYQKMPS